VNGSNRDASSLFVAEAIGREDQASTRVMQFHLVTIHP
jgi:hypothetical protein